MEGIRVRDLAAACGGVLIRGEADRPVTGIALDSRKAGPGDLFVALIGERVDAHRFLGQTQRQGAAAALISRDVTAEMGLTCETETHEMALIRVDDTKRALQAIGAYCRSRLSIPLIGITGSVGKTTTREMVAAALSAGFRVFRTPGNYNSQVGVPITLSEISAQDQIGVLELGMSEPGEMTVIAQIARVDMAVVTNIGITHIEQLGSQENIYREKMHIQDGMPEDGLLILNGDDPILRDGKAQGSRRTVYYGTGENCRYRAEDIRLENGCPVFTAVCGRERLQVRLQVMGRHNVLNAMAALAVAAENGVPLAAAAEKLQEYSGYQGRQQVFRERGLMIIDDTYNASPVSMKAALGVLSHAEVSGRRAAVLADMKELGPEERKFHREVGEFLRDHPADAVFLLGELAEEIGNAAEGFSGMEIRRFRDLEQMTEDVIRYLKPGDCVLLKGSHSMRLEETVKAVRERAGDAGWSNMPV